jgi:6-phosphogluconolactonase
VAVVVLGRPALRVFESREALALEVARVVELDARWAVARRGRFDLVLAGGSTPRRAYEFLARTTGDDRRLWERVHVWWGDERFVAPDDPRSNFRMARESLLDAVAIPEENVHPVPTDAGDAEAAARAYERAFPERPDLMLLGMGADGHTASLFPGSDALEERERLFVPVVGPAEPRLRITATPRAIESARSVLVVVAGREKADALLAALDGEGSAREVPARLLRGASWYADAEAAALLRSFGAMKGGRPPCLRRVPRRGRQA